MHQQANGSLIAVVGMAFEAKAVAGPGLRVICSGNGRGLAAKIDEAIRAGAEGLVSFGVAGGLDPTLRPGACVIASEVIHEAHVFTADSDWAERLAALLPQAVQGPIAGSPFPVADPAAKRALHARTGAVAVDMESHIVARVAAQHGLPMAAIRVVTDPAERALPRAALAGMRADGTSDAWAVMKALARRSSELPGLFRCALDVRAARATLLRSRQVLGPRLGFLDLGELRLDVA